jgi:hypothetical protein
MTDDPDREGSGSDEGDSPQPHGGQPRHDASQPAPAPTVGRVRAWIVSWIAMNVVWQVLVASLDFWETLAGLVAAAFAATAVEAVREQNFVEFRPEWSFFQPMLSAVWRTFAETPLVLALVWRRFVRREHVAGRFYTVPLELPDDRGRAAAKRSLFTIGHSISPNAYVVGYDEPTKVALMHEMIPRRRRE